MKRAKRVTEKVMQKLGKSDQTKDEVFEEFVTNFHKQNTAALRLQKELTKYMNALRVLGQCTKSLAEVLDDLYEPGWKGHDKYARYSEQRNLLWDDLLTSLQSKMVEPMSNYISRFPEVKSRIQKRERKVVDFDMTRREMESTRAKQKVTDQKIQQAEEAFSHAKQLYDEITDELYEELPAFYDSRIQFYASVFQSIAATEARFHGEVAKVEEEFAGVMDTLAVEAATGIHSTKKERTVDTNPKVLSRPGEESSDSEESNSHSPSLPHSPAATPTNNIVQTPPPPPSAAVAAAAIASAIAANTSPSGSKDESLTNSHETTPISTPTRTDSVEQKPPQKPKPPSTSGSIGKPPKPSRSSIEETAAATSQAAATGTEEPGEEEVFPPPSSPPGEKARDAITHSTDASSTTGVEDNPTSPVPAKSPQDKQPPPKPEPLAAAAATVGDREEGEGEKGGEINAELNVLYKVISTHPYEGEDEDELTFEKGVVILVIPYEDPEDEEEGWSMGIVEGTTKKGIFPDNFTKRLS